jgi:hypothetical protein
LSGRCLGGGAVELAQERFELGLPMSSEIRVGQRRIEFLFAGFQLRFLLLFLGFPALHPIVCDPVQPFECASGRRGRLKVGRLPLLGCDALQDWAKCALLLLFNQRILRNDANKSDQI